MCLYQLTRPDLVCCKLQMLQSLPTVSNILTIWKCDPSCLCQLWELLPQQMQRKGNRVTGGDAPHCRIVNIENTYVSEANSQRIVFRLPAVERQFTVSTAYEVITFWSRSKMPARLYHLLSLAYPTSFRIMRPSQPKCRLPGVCQSWLRRIFHVLPIDAVARRIHYDRPTTLW
jgi:hypothetical protein